MKEKEGINLGLSGALTKDVNTFNGIVIKYAEPPEARVPKRRWRFYVFKGEQNFISSQNKLGIFVLKAMK